MSRRKSVLVTGANGLVGKQLLDRLANSTHYQSIATDLRKPSEQLPGVSYDMLDVCRIEQIDAIFTQYKPEVVVHLASIVTPDTSDTRQHAYQVDVMGSQNIVQACLQHNVKRIVVTSSGAAYGYHADNPVPLQEQHATRGNEAFAYADHKRQVEEMLCEARATQPKLEQVVLRVGTVLGERVDNQITALFHKKRLLGVLGYDSPFVFIWDEDLAAILERSIGEGPAGVYNVSGDGAMSIEEIAKTLGKSTLKLPATLMRLGLYLGSSLGLSRYGPEQLVFLQYRPVLDNQRLKDAFGYTPQHSSKQAFDRWAKHVGLSR